ncbi:MAG: RNA-splicing ligase RtcB [Gammaproteobacteria bacterium RBG_16_51_14]|nr:MAG: RNA-splicing ligase RtcB [Gammaproteobacteria bacterium RBG_16_51_14]
MPIKQVIYNSTRHKVPVKVWTDDVDEKARRQLDNMGQLAFIHKHVAVMPDVHWGIGATIGAVIPTCHAIIPAAVGVDLGCGMMAVQTGLMANQFPDSLHGIRSAIEQAVPHGRTDNGGKNDVGAWKKPSGMVTASWASLISVDNRWKKLTQKHPKVLKGFVNTDRHLGTLGSGNHFIEVCLDENNHVWVMLHSGSRGIGNRIGTYFINLAKEEMKRLFIDIPDMDLAYLSEGSDYFNDYVNAVGWAQDYARRNREIMMGNVLAAMSHEMGIPVKADIMTVNCHHNYVAREYHYGADVWVTRKGAVRAGAGELGIIPGSMGARSFIVRGKGNPESFCSCSHGAGRKMGRKEAKRRFGTDDLKKQTAGVECRKDADVVDEIPSAYKDIDEVMANQSDLVEPLYTLKQVICVKG